MQPELSRSIVKNSIILGIFAVFTVGLVALTQHFTAERIAAAEKIARNQALAEILPADLYDNDLLETEFPLQDPLLGLDHPEPSYIASKNGKPTALVLRAIATDGYSGSIKLLIAIRADGVISGVRVLQHKETPGLGDKIELAKSSWILNFNQTSLLKPSNSGWAVKKDNGEFDQFSGATITPRAVVKAVHNSLIFFEQNSAAIFADYSAKGAN